MGSPFCGELGATGECHRAGSGGLEPGRSRALAVAGVGPNLRFPSAMMLPVVLAVLVVAVLSHLHGLSAPVKSGGCCE